MSPVFNHILSVILLTPLAGAGVLLVVSSRRPAAIKWLANGFALAGFLLSLPLWFLYEPLGKTWQFAERGDWLPAIGASYYVGVDGFSVLLILLTTLLGWIAILASWNEIKDRVKEFYVCMLVLQTGLVGAFMALDFLLFFLCVLTMLAAAYFIIGLWGEGKQRHPAITFLLVSVAGSVITLLGILTLSVHHHAVTGAYSFDITQYQTISVPFGVQKWVFLAFFLGFAVKVPMFPLHSWLPAAQTAAPTAGSVMLAAVLLKMGTYGFIRFSLPILPDASRYFATMIALLAIVGILYGAIAALAQRDWKRLVAYSSISQVSLAILAMFALTPAGLMGSMVLQITHGISTAALLLIGSAGAGTRRRTHHLAQIIFLFLTISAIALAAQNVVLPLVPHSRWWASAAAVGVVLGAASLFRLYRQTVMGRSGASNAPLGDLTAREMATMVPLVVLAIWVAVFHAPLQRRLETSVGRVAIRIDPAFGATVKLGSDCATPAKPDPAGPPPVFVLTEPCADGSDTGKPEHPVHGRTPR